MSNFCGNLLMRPLITYGIVSFMLFMYLMLLDINKAFSLC